jgi:hypothetical protein
MDALGLSPRGPSFTSVWIVNGVGRLSDLGYRSKKGSDTGLDHLPYDLRQSEGSTGLQVLTPLYHGGGGGYHRAAYGGKPNGLKLSSTPFYSYTPNRISIRQPGKDQIASVSKLFPCPL